MFIYLAASLIIVLTAFQAVMVVAMNSPKNAAKIALAPLMRSYDGPWVWQDWSLFAPAILRENLSVLVRAKLRNGTTTAWYDASLYFTDATQTNRLTPLRPLSEGLFHPATIEVDHGKLEPGSPVEVALIRTGAMVLRRYVGSQPRSIQIEIDGREITFGDQVKRVAAERELRSGWMPFPAVEPI